MFSWLIFSFRCTVNCESVNNIFPQSYAGDSFYTWFHFQVNIFTKDYGQTVLKMKHGGHHVCRPYVDL